MKTYNLNKGNKTETKYLQCILTEDELKKYSQNLAREAQEKSELEARKKQAMADLNAQISAKDADILQFATKINNGWEYRNVDCEWQYDWENGTKDCIRQDTFETVAGGIPIEPEERQQELGLVK